MDLKSLAALAALATLAAADEAPRWDASGAVRSELLSATVSGPSAADTLYATETGNHSVLDLALRFLPVPAAKALMAEAEFRFYQDWRALPSGQGSVAALRRLHAGGKAGSFLTFQAGDFRRRYTPLTLWAPGPELLEEPELFASRRADLLAERQLQLPDRGLQGLDLRYERPFTEKGLGTFLTGLRLDGVFTRLRRAEFLDAEGAQGLGLDRSDMDRFWYGAGGGLEVRRHFRLGGGQWRMADDRSTYETFLLGPETRKLVQGDAPNPGTSLNGRDSILSRTLTVTGFDAALDIAGILGKADRIFRLGFDWAGSKETNRRAWEYRVDTLGGVKKNVPVSLPVPGEQGKALRLDFSAGARSATTGSHWRFDAAYLKNDSTFLNPMAQSPAFAPARILNTENDAADGSLYTTFDALYNGVYRFLPSRKSAGHQRAPYQKFAWQGGIWAPEDLASFRPDPTLQLELPFGLATPDRQGFITRLEGSWRGALTAALAGAKLDSFRMVAAGMRLDARRLAANLPALTLNGSATFREAAAPDTTTRALKARLYMAGARWQMASKWALLAGWQQSRLVGPATETQGHWRGGLEYAVTRDAYFLLSGGSLSKEATSAAAPGAVPAKASFRQTLAHALVNARF